MITLKASRMSQKLIVFGARTISFELEEMIKKIQALIYAEGGKNEMNQNI